MFFVLTIEVNGVHIKGDFSTTLEYSWKYIYFLCSAEDRNSYDRKLVSTTGYKNKKGNYDVLFWGKKSKNLKI